MNYTSLKKISLTMLALVVGLAVSARANGPVTSAREKHGAGFPSHSMYPKLLPDEVYQIDDGTAEDAVGLTIGGDIICLNQFTVIPGQETITTINIAWGTPLFPDPSLDGLPYTVVVWGDPNNDGNPNDPANVLTTASGVVANQGTDTFINTAITPTTITGTSFFVGFLIPNTVAGQFPCAFDETNPTFSNRSYIAGGANGDINDLNNNDLPVAPIESFGLVGNWLIRADAGGGGALQLTNAASVKGGFEVALPGIEDRSGGAANKYTIVFTFNNNIVSVDSATASCGTVKNVAIESTDEHKVAVNMTISHACNASDITFTLNNVQDDQGNSLPTSSSTMSLLVGDVDADGTVTTSDLHMVKVARGQKTDATNFRKDANASGHIDNEDVNLVRGQVGTSLP